VKRFYKTAEAGRAEGALAILLDGRPVRTPGRRLLAMPNEALAQAVAAEWAGQGDTIRPDAMPLTRLTNTVVDQMPAKRGDALAEVMGYAATDLLCYRQASPADLAERQARTWQPWLDWAERRLGARLLVTMTLDPLPQPGPSLDALAAAAGALDDWRLVGLHGATRLTSSIVLGLALVEGAIDVDAAFAAALLEELYEIEHWGLEAEQARRHAALRADLAAAELYCRTLRPPHAGECEGIIA
jgi:chaperone required for assembly of F1-ATPase